MQVSGSKGIPRGSAIKNPTGLLQYLEQELSDHGLTEVVVSSTGCLKVCETGPSMVIYPENWWYGKIEGESDIDEIIDALEDGKPAGAYRIS